MILKNIFVDARYFQIVFQVMFLLYGIFYLHWQNNVALYATYFFVSVVTQIIFEIVKGVYKKSLKPDRILQGLLSAIISTMGLCLLLKTTSLRIAAVAAFISIASKYVIRIKGRHIFNPSAIGIVTVVLCSGGAWVNTGQWGNNAILFFTVISLGFIVTTKVQKLDISVAFLGTFCGLMYYRQIIVLGWPHDFFIQTISSGSLLLFSFFMITDPKTTPAHPTARILWAVTVAIFAYYLATFKFITAAPIFVLVMAQPIVPILNWLFSNKSFQWETNLQINTT